MRTDSPLTSKRAGGDFAVSHDFALQNDFIEATNMASKDSDRAPGPFPATAGNSNFSSIWDGRADDIMFADPALMMDPSRMGNLLQSTFDDWAALEGVCFPADESLYSVL